MYTTFGGTLVLEKTQYISFIYLFLNENLLRGILLDNIFDKRTLMACLESS